MSYVHNPTPAFVAPKHHKARPSFIRKLCNFVAQRKVWKWEGFYAIQPISPQTLKPIRRQRHFNLHRGRAIQAVTEAIAHHLNTVTGIAHISIEMLAHQCGLATKSDAGNESITRASRAVLALEEYGILKCEKVWDRTAGTWIPKLIEITPFFIQMCGLTESEYEAAQRQQLGFLKRGLSLNEQEQLTITEARRRAKENHRRIAFERRRKQNKDHAARRLAKKILAMELSDQRHEVTKKVTKSCTEEELIQMGPKGLKARIDKELGLLRRIADSPPI
ncbi:IncFII RepA protein family protein [compost metagenome]